MKITKSRYLLFLSIGILILSSIHQCIVYLQGYPISFQSAVKIEAVSATLIAIGSLVVLPEISKKSEAFVGRFMIMTTIQMLGVLSMAVWIAMSGTENYRSIVIHQMLFFIAAMAVQSLLLIASRKS